MERTTLIKRYISDTKNYLLSLGATHIKTNESNSVYMEINKQKIRISDHIVLTNACMNICFTMNNPGYSVVELNQNIMSFSTIKELKSFLKTYLDICICRLHSENKQCDVKINAKQQQIEKLNNEIAKLNSDIQKSKSELYKQIVSDKKEGVSLKGLSLKQVKSIRKQINQYKIQNAKK